MRRAAAKAEAPAVGAGTLVALVRERYEPTQGWCVFEQVPDATGYSQPTRRFADALALQTFPSRGITAHGFEVKVSRSDLVAELRQPKKAHAFQRFCSYWWLVVPDAELAAGLLLPETWGVLAIRRGKLHPVREAPQTEAESWSPGFVAAVLRTYQKALVPQRKLDELSAQIDAKVEERLAAAVEQAGYEGKRAGISLATLETAVQEFEDASGVRITPWQAGEIGEAVRTVLVLKRDRERLRGIAARVAQEAEMVAVHAGQVIAAVDDIAPPETKP